MNHILFFGSILSLRMLLFLFLVVSKVLSEICVLNPTQPQPHNHSPDDVIPHHPHLLICQSAHLLSQNGKSTSVIFTETLIGGILACWHLDTF